MILNADNMNRPMMLAALSAGFPITFGYVGSVKGACRVVDKLSDYMLIWGSVIRNEKGQIEVTIWPVSKTEH